MLRVTIERRTDSERNLCVIIVVGDSAYESVVDGSMVKLSEFILRSDSSYSVRMMERRSEVSRAEAERGEII